MMPNCLLQSFLNSEGGGIPQYIDSASSLSQEEADEDSGFNATALQGVP